ncbi:hypothetical protein JB92DRAFT_3093622 [Gautieria morchelliformis]|nr:hypothetical protein JB92DRAFT_3093622 [Gautieria morchelliformis]
MRVGAEKGARAHSQAGARAMTATPPDGGSTSRRRPLASSDPRPNASHQEKRGMLWNEEKLACAPRIATAAHASFAWSKRNFPVSGTWNPALIRTLSTSLLLQANYKVKSEDMIRGDTETEQMQELNV